jgi:hypothetical protein
MSALNNVAAMTCTANCVVEGQRFTKRFYLAVNGDEDDATTMGRALRRAREILSYQNGVTEESVLVESVTYA